jgi:hypothetical protein
MKEKDLLDFVVACASADDGAVLDKVLLKFTTLTPEASDTMTGSSVHTQKNSSARKQGCDNVSASHLQAIGRCDDKVVEQVRTAASRSGSAKVLYRLVQGLANRTEEAQARRLLEVCLKGARGWGEGRSRQGKAGHLPRPTRVYSPVAPLLPHSVPARKGERRYRCNSPGAFASEGTWYSAVGRRTARCESPEYCARVLEDCRSV